jgi:hypothetical protein
MMVAVRWQIQWSGMVSRKQGGTRAKAGMPVATVQGYKELREVMVGVMKRVALMLVVFGGVEAKAAVIRGWGELGFLGVIDHKIQFSKDGTYFDYDDQGGQDVLFPFARLWVGVALSARHSLLFLYQPLEIETRTRLEEKLVVDRLTYRAGTPLRLLYSFPFYRLSYLYDMTDDDEREVAIGLSLQIRNATISFSSLDGELFRGQRDVGPVPAIKSRTRFPLKNKWWWGTEVDAMWAPIKYINGSDTDVEGAIVDASLRGGYHLRDALDLFLSLRYLGGGAEGTSDDVGPGDGYVKNWLHFLTVSLGFRNTF